MLPLLSGKRAIIFGIVTRHSLGYLIAAAMKRAGAEVAITYQNAALSSRVKPLAKTLGATFSYACDVTKDAEIEQLFTSLKQDWDTFDILVHAIAGAPKEQLRGDYLNTTTREGFRIAHDITSYSFTALAKHAQSMLRSNGVLLTLTYLGSTRITPHYNVMGIAKASLEASVRYIASSLGPLGIRVNAISAAPTPTIAASGIQNFERLLARHKEKSPLRAPTTAEQVGNAAVCLCSDWMSGITGEVIHVDGGLHALSPLV